MRTVCSKGRAVQPISVLLSWLAHQIQFPSSPRVDKVIVMDQGRITAIGSYDELVEQGNSSLWDLEALLRKEQAGRKAPRGLLRARHSASLGQ